MKKRNTFLMIGILSIALILIVGCSKHADNIVGSPEEPELTTLLAVYSTEADGTPMNGVYVYTKEGVPSTLRSWPVSGRNLTPVEFNEVEPGSYTVIGIKAGYDTTVTSVTIYPGGRETVYLVMHKIPQDIPDPQDPCPDCPNQSYFDVHFDGIKILKFKGTVFEECQNDTLVLNGSEGPLVKIAVKDLMMECNTWYELDLSQYQYKYTRITFIYGDVWHYHTLNVVKCPVIQFGLVNVFIELYNDQWLGLIYIQENLHIDKALMNYYQGFFYLF